jgi:hypothetical protein
VEKHIPYKFWIYKEKTMVNKKFWLGILVMVLVFGMTVIGCDNGSSGGGDTNYFDILNLSNSTPNDSTLSAVGLNQTKFTQIRDAAAGGFQGWTIGDDGFLLMAWTGRSLSNFNSVVDELKTIFGFGEPIYEYESGVYAQGIIGEDKGILYSLVFFSTRLSEDGLYLPAGSMMLDFYYK